MVGVCEAVAVWVLVLVRVAVAVRVGVLVTVLVRVGVGGAHTPINVGTVRFIRSQVPSAPPPP